MRGCRYAQMKPEEKNLLSHRYIALEKLRVFLLAQEVKA
jgi:inosine/xanthosine triphosphate pyrophosphatase family protein